MNVICFFRSSAQIFEAKLKIEPMQLCAELRKRKCSGEIDAIILFSSHKPNFEIDLVILEDSQLRLQMVV